MNPLHNAKGNFCVNCNERFVFSFSTFEVLPLVELRLDDDLTDDEALQIVEKANESRVDGAFKNAKPAGQAEENVWFEERTGNAEFLKLNANSSNDHLLENLENVYELDRLNRDAFAQLIAQLNLNELLVLDWPSPLRTRFFRNMVPEISVSRCSNCNKFFQTDDFETQILMHGSCLFCRSVQKVQ